MVMPSQMDVASWCFKWMGWVGWLDISRWCEVLTRAPGALQLDDDLDDKSEDISGWG